ncbi:MAG TPA: hypothetical protein VKO83_10190, partial [Steroidobacteraceae bacterium]|nr:hypothetical protein [Steroidobacteraceae bacterium]
ERATLCEEMHVTPAWLAERLRATCRRAIADEGTSLRNIFLASLPRSMFLFLPLIASGMLLLYWRPRRWYVEHLVFFLHAHSAVFVVGSAELLLQLASRAWPALAGVASFTLAAMFCWLAVYLFLAMRRFYGQSRRRTFAKLLVIGLFYALSMVLMVGLTAMYSALTAQ